MLTESDVAWQAAENGILQPVVGVRAVKAARQGGHRPRPTSSSKHRATASATVEADSTAAGAAIMDSLDHARLDAIADAPKQLRGSGGGPRGGGGSGGGAGLQSSRVHPQRSASGGLGDEREARQLRGMREGSHSGPLQPPREAARHSGPQPRVSTRDSHSGPQLSPPPLLRAISGGQSGPFQHPDPHVGTTLGLDMKASQVCQLSCASNGS
jgi:hypothetical protein